MLLYGMWTNIHYSFLSLSLSLQEVAIKLTDQSSLEPINLSHLVTPHPRPQPRLQHQGEPLLLRTTLVLDSKWVELWVELHILHPLRLGTRQLVQILLDNLG